MTQQALARTWRPRDFDSLVGQEHVVRALSHALDTGRLHHAYLFTGTRGVGKTTIARILAKALNCVGGVGSHPCNACAACLAIDSGRFVDCIELDAASNRGVEDMTQLLENAVYAPTVGRYKVYVIDEVHMLSNHAFNAMLKTLEEPPPHVVFVLATTDPQKVPVTVLSRCLQFGLRNMPATTIASHLALVLGREGIEFDSPALSMIARAASGSMRDALSLLDQAIAFAGGRVGQEQVSEMLGVVERDWLERIVQALAQADGAGLVAIADAMLESNLPFDVALADLAAIFQRVAVHQAGVRVSGDDAGLIAQFAQQLAAEDVQACYQIVLHGRRDLPLAPDPHTGFTMTLLRMLAFRAEDGPLRGGVEPVPGRTPAARPPEALLQMVARAPTPSPGLTARPQHRAEVSPTPPGPPQTGGALPPEGPLSVDFDGDWPSVVARVRVGGMAAQCLQQSVLLGFAGSHFRIRVPIRALAEPATVNRAREALSVHFGQAIRLTVEVGAVDGPTAASLAGEAQAERQAQATRSIESDPFVRTLIEDFDGRIVPGSIRPSVNPPPEEKDR
jgi:DNA polymerase III subunit gamma/tau